MPRKKTNNTTLQKIGIVANCELLNVRIEPNKVALVNQVIPAGTKVVIEEDLGEWLKIENGFVMAEFINVVE